GEGQGEGQGEGCAVVAMHLHLDQRVALKLPRPAGLDGDNAPSRFAREARTAARLRGDHTVQLLDVEQLDDGRPLLVFEYLTGHDLATVAQARGPLPVEEALRYALETCEALAEAHGARVVHGSLRLRRLFLAERPGKRPRVKVLGFGAASADGLSCSAARSGAYRSPEQLISPMHVDARTDQWGLGAALYELLAGARPFDGASTAHMLSAVLMGAPRRLREVRPEVPHGLDDVVLRCLRSTPADRFSDIAVLAAALAPFAAQSDRSSAGVAARLLDNAAASTAPTLPPPADGASAATAANTENGASGSTPGRRSVPPAASASRRPDPREEPTPEGLLREALVESLRPAPRSQTSGSDRPGRAGLTEVHRKPDGPRDPRREAE
ncbi:MAG TPA: serine/threonine-protein kinase, partial [Polyangiaceae bacterium]|nr:serine/threonine-protein kinase [Polyangiaceae bacterium]